jgi:hypothetical protein
MSPISDFVTKQLYPYGNICPGVDIRATHLTRKGATDDVVDETRENLSRLRTEVEGLIPMAERAVEVAAQLRFSVGL